MSFVILKLVLVFSALAGFLLTLYISHKKHAHETMVCPIGGHCEAVIHSQYSQFFGIPIEWIGLLYYGVIALSYITIFVAPDAIPSIVRLLLLFFTITAFLFSVYLTCLQAFTLWQWCTLCLTSASFCSIIFILSLLTSEQSLPLLLAQYMPLITTLHMIAFAVGLGAATITDIFFIKFLQDFRISESENDVLKTLSEIMWCALALIILSGIGKALVLGMPWVGDPITSIALIALFVVVCAGAVLNLFVMPKLLHISFKEKHEHEPGELRHIHRLAFIVGAVSLSSWYTAFILTVMPNPRASFLQLLGIYCAVLLGAGCLGRILEYITLKRRSDG